MTFGQGASFPYAFQTAYHALVEIANLQHDGSVLIHSALSSVGMAAILGKLTCPLGFTEKIQETWYSPKSFPDLLTHHFVVAQHIGAQIFATVSSEAGPKRDILITNFGIPATHIFSNTSDVFRRGLHRITNGRGVDVILNSLPGFLTDTWSCIAGTLSLLPWSWSVELCPIQI